MGALGEFTGWCTGGTKTRGDQRPGQLSLTFADVPGGDSQAPNPGDGGRNGVKGGNSPRLVSV